MDIRGRALAAGFAAAAIGAVALVAAAAPPDDGPRYTTDGKLQFPADYRTWVYLSTGMDMSYVEGSNDPAMHMLDNVFVDRAAYAAFQKTGTWPDKTMFVLEARRAVQKGSINKRGHFQADRMAVEVHVKDAARFKDTAGWGFFAFPTEAPGQMLPRQAACYACHEAHGAVDTTFVQFYPTLLPLAQARKTLSEAYLKDEAASTR